MTEGRRPFRPPWWPENEPFPPAGPAWRRRRGHFVRRVGLILVAFFLLTFLATALAAVLFSGRFGPAHHRTFGPLIGLLALLLLFFLFGGVGRVVRRTAQPLGDVMEAADRVSAGQYDVRVRERGSPEVRRLARSFNSMTQRLGASEELRRNLLADVAHELRTPLSIIQGNAEAMLDGVYAADAAHLEPLLDEARVMSRLLDDLQTLSTAEAGVLALHREPVEPAQLVEDAASAFRPEAESLGVAVEVDVADGLPLIQADRVRVGEILANLMTNSLRATSRGGSVRISAELADGERGVAFSVADTGPGIPPEVLPHVFERFVKAGPSGGAGLGLAIAKGLVESHGGEISAESRPGEGTRMRFVLPVAEA
jgi:signal transduction histidine kinase